MRRAYFVALPLFLAIPLLIGIAGRSVARPRAFPSADNLTVLRFEQHHNLYFRHLFGCPLTATEASECRPAAGWVDTEEWRKARELAKRVFGLKD